MLTLTSFLDKQLTDGGGKDKIIKYFIVKAYGEWM
jgi:hypothetical protein